MAVKMIPVIEQDQNSAWAMNRRRTWGWLSKRCI